MPRWLTCIASSNCKLHLSLLNYFSLTNLIYFDSNIRSNPNIVVAACLNQLFDSVYPKSPAKVEKGKCKQEPVDEDQPQAGPSGGAKGGGSPKRVKLDWTALDRVDTITDHKYWDLAFVCPTNFLPPDG